MKKYVIISVSAIALAFGGGFGASFFLSPSHAGDTTEILAPPVYEEVVVELGRMMVPVHQNRRVTHVIADMKVVLLLEDGKEEVTPKELAILRNAAIEEMNSYSTIGKFSGRQIDTEELSRLIKDRIKLDSSIEVKDILFTQLVRQNA